MRTVLFLALSAALLAQTEGPRMLSVQQYPAIGEIGVYYFDGLNESQVWITLETEGLEKKGINPIFFNITAKFPGKKIDRRPMMVELRVQARCDPILLPSRVFTPTFKLTIGTDPMLDLSANGRTSHFITSCGGNPGPHDLPSTLDTVVTSVPFETLRHLADANSATMTAIGFSVGLTPENFDLLRTYAQILERGVVVRTP